MSNPFDFLNKPPAYTGMPSRVAILVPGVVLCGVVTLVAVTIQTVEEIAVGHPYVEAIVLAILLGTAIRTIWEPGQRWCVGIDFTAKQLLEIAVALLGASVTLAAIEASGFLLLGAILTTVILTLAVSYFISRFLGLSIGRTGGRVTTAVTLSLLFLLIVSLCLVWLCGSRPILI